MSERFKEMVLKTIKGNTFVSSNLTPTAMNKIFFILAGVLVLLVGGFFLLNNYIFSEKQASTPNPTPTPVPSLQGPKGDIIFPEDAGVINVQSYGAKGDGKTDDTAAILRAIRENSGAVEQRGAIIYFPKGTYLVSDRLEWGSAGNWAAWLTFQGQNRDKTIIKLKDRAGGYGDPSNPRAVVFTTSICASCKGNVDWQNLGEGNEGFSNNIFDLTIDTGRANPGAIGVDYIASNNGHIRNVAIKSGDGSGAVGLALVRQWPGPALVTNVAIDGFDYGIYAKQKQYGITFEHITLRNQKVAGIRNEENVLSIRDLQSTNIVSAIQNPAPQGLITLIDGTLRAGNPQVSAIDNGEGVAPFTGGELYLRNIQTTGYKSVIKNKGTVIPGKSVTEFHSRNPNAPYSVFPSPDTSLHLAVKETPDIPWDPIDQWINVQDFGADASGNKGFDNTPAVQKAIDDANRLAKTTLYFPKGRYAFGDTVRIYGSIQRVHFLGSGIGVVNSSANKFADGRPLFQVEQGDHPAVLLEGAIGFGTGATVGPDFVSIKQTSSKALVMRNMGGTYTNTPGSGPLFLEDQQTCGVFTSTEVWARQLNPEICSGDPQNPRNPKILNDGSTLWILGFKTEKPTTNIETIKGGSTEVLGGLLYPVEPVPQGTSAFINNESNVSLVYAVKADGTPAKNYEIQMKEIRNGVTKFLNRVDVLPRGAGSIVPLYVGYPTE